MELHLRFVRVASEELDEGTEGARTRSTPAVFLAIDGFVMIAPWADLLVVIG
jgi:hypothetical protein